MDCPVCGSLMIGHGHKARTIRHPAIRDYKGIILYHANRYICRACRKTAIEKNPFAFDGFNSSFFLLQSTMKLLGNLNYSLQMISDELQISTTQLTQYLDSYVTVPQSPLPVCLSIDEIHNRYISKKNSSYLCILIDNEKRHIHDVPDSRKKHDLFLYFSKIPSAQRCRVRYITIDMWEPYRDVAATYFPDAVVAVDPFHVIKHLVQGFAQLRIDLMDQCGYGSNAYYLLKKWHWLLMKDDVHPDNARVYNKRFAIKLNRRDLFNMITETFPVLEQAHLLKEEYRKFNRECSYDDAADGFDALAAKFKNSAIGQSDEYESILAAWKDAGRMRS